jgi:hypothetical protein
MAIRPWIDHAEIEVHDAALPDRCLPTRVRLDHQLALVKLVEHHGRLDARHLTPLSHALAAQRDDRLRGQPGVVVEQDDLDQPL